MKEEWKEARAAGEEATGWVMQGFVDLREDFGFLFFLFFFLRCIAQAGVQWHILGSLQPTGFK